MAAKYYNVVSARPGKDGKKNYLKIGVLFPAREGDGFSIKMDALPLPNEKGEIWLNAYPPREDENQNRGKPASSSAPIDDDIPF